MVSAFLKGMAFILALTTLTYFAYHLSREESVQPCSPLGMPGRCYHIPEAACSGVWKKAFEDCDKFVKSLNLPPGRLVGPIIHQCQLSNLDLVFNYSRKSDPECLRMHDELQDWRRRNQ
jgi:hypothetical protein